MSKQQSSIKKYLKENFSKRNNLTRLLFVLIGAIIVLIPSLTCNLMIRNDSWTWTTPVANDGIAFSWLDGQYTIIYLIQSLICVFVFITILFVNEWYYIILLSLALTGGLFNLFDRAFSFDLHGITNSVIDYLPTGGTTSNFPDVFILTGIIGFGVIFLIMSIVNSVKGTKKHD